jgi:hypothetical protein
LRALVERVQSSPIGEYRDVFDVVTVADLKSILSPNELEQVTFAELGTILAQVRSREYADVFERMSFAEFDRAFGNRGLRAIPVGELEALTREYRRYLEYEDAFEAIDWHQLDRTIESRNLGTLSVGEVVRLFEALRPVAGYEDVLERLSVGDIRNMTTRGLDTFTLADALFLPELAARQAEYVDVFDHLNLADLKGRLGVSGLSNITISQLRNTLERLRRFTSTHVS